MGGFILYLIAPLGCLGHGGREHITLQFDQTSGPAALSLDISS